jgi:hypothetical protein
MSTEPRKSEVPAGYDPPASQPGIKWILITIAVVVGTIAIGYYRG